MLVKYLKVTHKIYAWLINYNVIKMPLFEDREVLGVNSF